MKWIGAEVFRKIMFVLNMTAAIGLLLSLLSLFISPEFFWMLAFMGLAFPFLFAVNILFILYWVVIRWQRALFSGILVIIGFTKIGDFYNFSAPPTREDIVNIRASDSTLHIMNYNVRLFDLYNWTNNKLTRNKIMDVIRKEQADILCFQEFFYDDTKSFNTLDTLLEIQPARYKHIAHTATVKNVNHWGIATFSRFPIINRGLIPFRDSTDNISIFSDVKAYGDTIRVYNLHLESVRFRKEDYKALKTLTGNEDQTDLEGPQRIISRMRRAYIRRARQTDIIATHIKESPHPVIVCGDFNDPPNSYTYHQITQSLQDAFIESGAGWGSTYVGLIPFLRIDYILYTPEIFKSLYFKVIRKKLSDHYPIVSTLRLQPKNQKE